MKRLRILREHVGDDGIAGAQDADLDAGAIHQRDEIAERHAVLPGGRGGRLAVGSPGEDALVVGEAVPRQRRQPFRIAIARRMRGLLELAWIAALVRRQIAFEVDDFAHCGCPPSHSCNEAFVRGVSSAMRLVGLIIQVPATSASTTMPGITASQVPVAASAPVPAQPVDDSASAKVATRDEVCRRRKTLRLAWVRNQY